ncbi:MAG: ABC transporter ATP-binding protein [Spirochaetia bacterium]|nr:ABC transporter ATP-binding protein [Spirochaetota bacterium]MCX8095872.1 ABC transporter ATP-binding protein [Spirochaetota bacterium]MDW8112601.1 ABC transporter ATP-binding protein [Spirochaetia bacterium]
MELLRVDNIVSGYGKIEVLKGVSIEVRKDEIVCILGANGAGKTTLANTIMGLVSLKKGSIYFLGKDISNYPIHERVKLGLAQVPEGRKIFPKLTVLENLEMGAFLVKDVKAKKEDIEYVFSLFPILYERREQKAGTLSGGEQQMLAISRALMSRPKVMILDEPSMGLAVKAINLIFKVLLDLKKNMSLLLIEQNANKALEIGDRGYVIETGRIVLSGDRDTLKTSEEVKKAYLG